MGCNEGGTERGFEPSLRNMPRQPNFWNGTFWSPNLKAKPSLTQAFRMNILIAHSSIDNQLRYSKSRSSNIVVLFHPKIEEFGSKKKREKGVQTPLQLHHERHTCFASRGSGVGSGFQKGNDWDRRERKNRTIVKSCENTVSHFNLFMDVKDIKGLAKGCHSNQTSKVFECKQRLGNRVRCRVNKQTKQGKL